MISRLSTFVVCALVLAASPAAQQKSDHDLIQGTWKFESGIMGGKAMTDEDSKSTTIVIAGNKMKLTGMKDGKANTMEMTFKLDPTKTPKAVDVDLDGKGKTGLGIYSLEGDTLRICHGEDTDPRPTEFASKEGSRLVLVVLKRAK